MSWKGQSEEGDTRGGKRWTAQPNGQTITEPEGIAVIKEPLEEQSRADNYDEGFFSNEKNSFYQ